MGGAELLELCHTLFLFSWILLWGCKILPNVTDASDSKFRVCDLSHLSRSRRFQWWRIFAFRVVKMLSHRGHEDAKTFDCPALRARILSPNLTRWPLPCLLIQSFLNSSMVGLHFSFSGKLLHFLAPGVKIFAVCCGLMFNSYNNIRTIMINEISKNSFGLQHCVVISITLRKKLLHLI